MRIRGITRTEVRKHVPFLRTLNDKALSSFGIDVARTRDKGPYLRILGKLIEREIQRRIRRGTYDLWH